MGGAAFSQASSPGEPTLYTPRMTAAEYTHLKATYLERLQAYFPHKPVSVLVEAPEKSDYGDIDFLVCSDERVDTVHLARQLGATGVICNSSGKHQMCSIGVPKDGSPSAKETVIYKNVPSNNPKKLQPSSTLTVAEYAQIDIEIVPPEDFEWHGFYCSYGDLGGLLGNIVRNLGFTVNDKGLVLRLEELDDAKAMKIGQIADKDGLLHLSNDPDRVLDFLGLSAERYKEGFTTVESLYEWLAQCRLISLKLIRRKRDISRDRQKERKRTLYSTFFHEWLPQKLGVNEEEHEEDDTDDTPTREQLVNEAITFFDKAAQYKELRDNLRLSIGNLIAERLLKPIIGAHSGSKDKKLAEIVRAFRRWVAFKEQPFIVASPHGDSESQLYGFLESYDNLVLRDEEVVDRWVAEHWEEVKRLERERVKASSSSAIPENEA